MPVHQFREYHYPNRVIHFCMPWAVYSRCIFLVYPRTEGGKSVFKKFTQQMGRYNDGTKVSE